MGEILAALERAQARLDRTQPCLACGGTMTQRMSLAVLAIAPEPPPRWYWRCPCGRAEGGGVIDEPFVDGERQYRSPQGILVTERAWMPPEDTSDG